MGGIRTAVLVGISAFALYASEASASPIVFNFGNLAATEIPGGLQGVPAVDTVLTHQVSFTVSGATIGALAFSSNGAGSASPDSPTKLVDTTQRPGNGTDESGLGVYSNGDDTSGTLVEISISEQLVLDVSNILAAYQAALSKGARVIVGPLTKNAVGALADSDITLVPTLALSVPDIEIARANLYLFGLSLDAETRQLAQFVAHEGRHSVLVLYSANSFGKRLQATFSDEWLRLGGQILEQSSIGAGTDFKALHERVAALQPDAIFLATNAHEAQRVRPYLFETIPLYATSQVFRAGNEANRTLDLDGVRFLDMPWLLQPDHPAVMVYPRAERALGTDGERLYAMGIDAFRLAQLFFRGEMPTSGLVLDGVTGQISLGANHQFTRELSTAEFQDDEAVVRDHAKP